MTHPHGIFIGCIYRLGWRPIQYCLGSTVGTAGYTQNIDLVYLLVRLIVHLYCLGANVSLIEYPILSKWYNWINWIHTEYSLSVSIGQADSPSNIIWVVLSDQPDTHWIFIGCTCWSAWQCIQYWVSDTVGSAGYPLNIHWVYPLVRLTVYPILAGWYRRISRIPTEY